MGQTFLELGALKPMSCQLRTKPLQQIPCDYTLACVQVSIECAGPDSVQDNSKLESCVCILDQTKKPYMERSLNTEKVGMKYRC